MSEKKDAYDRLKEMHESDMTAKERKQLEWHNFKNMSWRQRAGFFWDYYKWTLVILIIVIIAINEGIGIYKRLQQTVLLSIAVMDTAGSTEDNERFSGDLAKAIGTGDPLEVVDLDTAFISGDSVAAVTKLTVLLGARITDMLIINEETYNDLEAEEAFRSWKDILGDEYEQYAALFDEKGRLELSDNKVWQSYNMTLYEPVYCCMLASSDKVENAAAVPAFFSGQTS